jgi:low temperature requirement protein LtrA
MSPWTFLSLPAAGAANGTAGRRATWLELFFDLIFVAAVAQVGSPLHATYSFAALARYAFLFFLIWWAWLGHTLYSTRFDTDDPVQRALTLVQMFTVAVMAANAGEALDSRSAAGFGAAYAAMRIVLVVQYVRARSVEKSRRLTNRYAAGFGLAALLWLVAAFLDSPDRFWIWGIALFVEIATPMLSGRHDHELPPHPEHLPERFGLFTIILMGESLVAIMRGIESQETWTPPAASAAFFGMALVFGLWWWYFDGAHAAKERHIRRARDFRLFRLWSYAHFPLYLGVATVGIGVERVIGLNRGAILTRGEAWLLAVAATVMMVSLAVIAATSDKARSSRSVAGFLMPHCVVASAILLLPALALPLVPHFFVIVLAILAVLQVALSRNERKIGLRGIEQAES